MNKEYMELVPIVARIYKHFVMDADPDELNELAKTRIYMYGCLKDYILHKCFGEDKFKVYKKFNRNRFLKKYNFPDTLRNRRLLSQVLHVMWSFRLMERYKRRYLITPTACSFILEKFIPLDETLRYFATKGRVPKQIRIELRGGGNGARCK